MTDRLSRERIAELRDAARNYLHNERGSQFWRDILVVIDAYEAQRPRPASEPPAGATYVLTYSANGWARGWWMPEAECWYTIEHGYVDVTHWLPLPPAPERDDG